MDIPSQRMLFDPVRRPFYADAPFREQYETRHLPLQTPLLLTSSSPWSYANSRVAHAVRPIKKLLPY